MSHQFVILYIYNCIVPEFCPLKEFCVTVLSQDAELWVSGLNAARDIANGKVPAHSLAAKVFFKLSNLDQVSISEVNSGQ